MDLSVGRILDTLDRMQVTDDTLAIFTSDNGGVLMTDGDRPEAVAYRSGFRCNGTLRGRKHSIYQGGFRVPFIARGPGHVQAQTVCDETISLVDMYATMAALTNKSEFEIVDSEGEVLRRGRYETNANSAMTKAIRRAGLTVWPQVWHGIRNYRLNELSQLGYRQAEISAWCGNFEATRKVHYGSTAVTPDDRRKAAGVSPRSAGVSMVYDESTETSLGQLVQQMAQSGKSRELLEIIQKALIQSDSGEIEIAEQIQRKQRYSLVIYFLIC